MFFMMSPTLTLSLLRRVFPFFARGGKCQFLLACFVRPLRHQLVRNLTLRIRRSATSQGHRKHCQCSFCFVFF